MAIIRVNAENFETEVLNAKGIVLVEFFAEWCGPCQGMAPVLVALSDELKGKAKVCKVDVDESQALAVQNGVMAVPTFKIFKNGKVVDTFSGAISKESLKSKVLANR